MANEPWMQLFPGWQKPDKPTAFDCYGNCVHALPTMKKLGYNIAIRYYDHTANTKHPSDKILTVHEAHQILHEGFDIVVVYESTNNLKYLNGEPDGLLHGRRAGLYATNTIQQPMGSAIYFAVDLDIGSYNIKSKILPYFRGVIAGMKEVCLGGIPYKVGVYGSGATCAAVYEAGLAQFYWLANATGWAGYNDFKASDRWHLMQKITKKENISARSKFAFDPNIVGKPDVGQFTERQIL